jgi:hypothetical protein
MYFYADNKYGQRTLYSLKLNPDYGNSGPWFLYPEFCCPTIQLLNLKSPPKVSYYNTDR